MSRESSLTWGGRTVTSGPGELPAVAVSLTGPTAARARVQARHAIDAGADVLELRVDLLEEADALVGFAEASAAAASVSASILSPRPAPAGWRGTVGGGTEPDDESVTEASGEQAPAPDPMVVATAAAQVLECLRRMADVVDGAPLLLTCRTAAEGGRAHLDDAGYSALLRAVLDELAGWAPERRPRAIDVEVQRGCLPQVAEQAHALGVDVVASFHDFEATPADAVLEEVLDRMVSEGADLAKIAVWPTSADDVARLLGVCARATAGPGEGTGLGVPVAAMSMGALGAVSRVSPVFGTALTFAVVPDELGESQASAPGQLPIQDVRRCLELLRA
ncbi:type I 3-dehydroquinate dehydratase [Actinomyces sp. ZJ308]|uniref:type I 3-dehydroquinate dehydratase n=1 Tax=Actinomyces sp. ZJ308 TaxID=2708342 RepID=UPI0014232BDB|nr:type I 3-dehydroquinate dehydratase [Actinomyces sp. ZJ308]